MTSIVTKAGGILLSVSTLLWVAGQVFGYGVNFDKPGIPQGAHLVGPAAKGTITYTVNPAATPPATIQFTGRCRSTSVTTGPIDITSSTNAAAFATATEKAIADWLEGFFLDIPAAFEPFRVCYPTLFGIYVTAINKSLTKTPNVWVGEATIQGVTF